MRRLRRDDSGAAAVEFAILIPTFMMIILGMVSAGQAYSHKLALTGGAREGARFAATLRIDPLGLDGLMPEVWLNNVLDVAQSAGGSSAGAGAPGLMVCAAYVAGATDPAGSPTTVSKMRGGTTTTTPCFTETTTFPEAHVQVLVRRDSFWTLVVVPNATVTLTGRGTTRYERGS